MSDEFMNDNAIYYLIPGTSEVRTKKACTFPRNQEHLVELDYRKVASCPGSPTLSSAEAEGPPCTRAPSPPKPTERSDDSKKKNGSNSGKSVHLENFYCSLRKVAKISKRKSSLWWRRKGSQKSDEQECPSSSTEDPEVPDDCEAVPVSPSRITNGIAPPEYPSVIPDSPVTVEEDGGDCTYIQVCGGTSYVKPKPAEKKLRTLQALDSLDTNGSLECLVSEWQKKSRWLSRRQKRKGSKFTGDTSFDVAIVYSQIDGCPWATYFGNHMPHTLSASSSTTLPRIRKITVEELYAHSTQPGVLSRLVRDSKLQVVIISPAMVTFLKEHSKVFDLGKMFRSKRVLALMLKVTDDKIFNDSILMSSLFAFESWTRLNVRDKDFQFVREAEKAALNILVQSEAYSDFQYSKAFRIFPRKVTSQHSKVYIHLVSPIQNHSSYKISLQLPNGSVDELPSAKEDIENPYTIKFVIPDKYISRVSCQILSVHLTIDEMKLGFKELKCEGALEVIRSSFENAENALELMEEALGFFGNKQQNLDSLLASRLQKNIAFHQLLDDDLNDPVQSGTVSMPTWLHFGATYGLEKFCDTLLKLPGYNKLLSVKDIRGNTPHLAAYKHGHVEMARNLEEKEIKPIVVPPKKSFSPRIEVPDMDYVEIMPMDDESPPPPPAKPRLPLPEYLTMLRVNQDKPEETQTRNDVSDGTYQNDNEYHDYVDLRDTGDDDDPNGIYRTPKELPKSFVSKHFRNDAKHQTS